ncbi:MAG: hypothetical protein WCI18_14685 [Pseudomonadota bacterium]
MVLSDAPCSANSTPWVESIFISGKESWIVEAEGFGRSAVPAPDSFFKLSLSRHPPFQRRLKSGQAYFMGAWSLQQAGLILGYAEAISEDKPLNTCRLMVHLNSVTEVTSVTEALSYLMTGVLIMSGADILEVGILEGDILSFIEANSEMQAKQVWTYNLDFLEMRGNEMRGKVPLSQLNLLSLTLPAWEIHPLGKLRLERLNYLKIRRARLMELQNPKPKKVKRSLISRIFKPKISD